jgi:hypothetical protein
MKKDVPYIKVSNANVHEYCGNKYGNKYFTIPGNVNKVPENVKHTAPRSMILH